MSFPRPWTVQSSDDAFWIESANGKKFGFVYYRSDRDGLPPELARSYHSKDEARRLVMNFAKLGQ